MRSTARCSIVNMPSPSRSNFTRPAAAQSSLSHWSTDRPSMRAHSIGQNSTSGRSAITMPPEWMPRWRCSPRPASPRRRRPVRVRRRRGQADQDQRRLLLPARLHAELPRLRVDDHALRGPVRPDVLRRRRQVHGRQRPGVRRRSYEWQKDLVDALGGYDEAGEVPHHLRRRVRRQEPLHDRPGRDGASTASGAAA